MSQTRTEAVELILSVLRDGSRSDRYLRQAEDGHYFTTPDHTFLTAAGPETPVHVEILVATDTTESDEEEWAEQLLGELDELVAA